MDEFQVNFPGGDFRSGELNMEGAIPSVGVMRGASTSAARAGVALQSATTRIVEIGGQFDTQALAAPQGAPQSGVAESQEGKELLRSVLPTLPSMRTHAKERSRHDGFKSRSNQWTAWQWATDCTKLSLTGALGRDPRVGQSMGPPGK